MSSTCYLEDVVSTSQALGSASHTVRLHAAHKYAHRIAANQRQAQVVVGMQFLEDDETCLTLEEVVITHTAGTTSLGTVTEIHNKVRELGIYYICMHRADMSRSGARYILHMSAQSGYVTVRELGIYYICLHRADMSRSRS